jgi:hypothetical protein
MPCSARHAATGDLRSQMLQVRILSGKLFHSRPKCPSPSAFRRASFDDFGLYATCQVAAFDANCALPMQNADNLMAPLRAPRAAGEHPGNLLESTDYQHLTPRRRHLSAPGRHSRRVTIDICHRSGSTPERRKRNRAVAEVRCYDMTVSVTHHHTRTKSPDLWSSRC